MTQLWTTTGYPPRNGQDQNQMYSGAQIAVPQYSSGNNMNYFNNDAGHQHSALTPSYAHYPTSYVPSQHGPGPLMYMHTPGAVPMPYQMPPSSGSTLPSQPRSMSQHHFYHQPMQISRAHQHTQPSLAPDISLADTEEQESPNQETMCSEPIVPPLEGFPDVDDFDNLMKQYVENLSPKKQDKALIHAKRAANIKMVLIDKKTTMVESAQFRFWVKKMFKLEPQDQTVPSRKKKICHEGKPVAIREKLFKILTRAHRQCQHGGRDKTSAQVRRVYSWVPKELISRFVKLCPTCQVRRSTNRTSPTRMENCNGPFSDPQSPELGSPNQPRRQALEMGTQSKIHSPIMQGFSTAFQQQNRWMTSAQPTEKSLDRVPVLETSDTTMMDIDMHSPISPHSLTPTPTKYIDDPGTSYLPSSTMQNSGAAVGAHYHHDAYSAYNSLNEMTQNDRTYRLRRTSAFKREHHY